MVLPQHVYLVHLVLCARQVGIRSCSQVLQTAGSSSQMPGVDAISGAPVRFGTTLKCPVHN